MSNHKELQALIGSWKPHNSAIKELKECIICENNQDADAKLEFWLKGCIESLFYKPNHKILVLSSQTSAAIQFLFDLFPQEEYCSREQYPNLYETFITCNIGLCDWRNYKKIAFADQFKIGSDGAEKRLVNLCGTTIFYSENYLSNVLLLKVRSVDLVRFQALNKQELWGALYQKYKL